MSWLSELTHIHISAPPIVQSFGDSVAAVVTNAVPGGNTVDSLFDLTNTRGGGRSPRELVAAAKANIENSARVGLGAATAASNAQSAATDFSAGLSILTRNPLLLVALLGGLYLVARKT